MPTADRPIPNRPASKFWMPPEQAKLAMTAMPMMTTGTAVDIMPRERPLMMIVAAPVSEDSASFWVGL